MVRSEARDAEGFFQKLVDDRMAENDEILRHKWFESEKAGRDVGYSFARMDWILRHRTAWMKKGRRGAIRGQ